VSLRGPTLISRCHRFSAPISGKRSVSSGIRLLASIFFVIRVPEKRPAPAKAWGVFLFEVIRFAATVDSLLPDSLASAQRSLALQASDRSPLADHQVRRRAAAATLYAN
jgi:hypothetical protein